MCSAWCISSVCEGTGEGNKMKNYFWLLCVETVHLPSVLHVHKREGQGEKLDFCGSLQLERAQPCLGCLFPASSHLKAPWQIGNEWSSGSNPLSSTGGWSNSLLVNSQGGNLPLLLLKACKDFTDREWAQAGCFQTWSPSCPGFIPSFPCQARASEQLRSYISSSASSKCLF